MLGHVQSAAIFCQISHLLQTFNGAHMQACRGLFARTVACVTLRDKVELLFGPDAPSLMPFLVN